MRCIGITNITTFNSNTRVWTSVFSVAYTHDDGVWRIRVLLARRWAYATAYLGSAEVSTRAGTICTAGWDTVSMSSSMRVWVREKQGITAQEEGKRGVHVRTGFLPIYGAHRKGSSLVEGLTAYAARQPILRND